MKLSQFKYGLSKKDIAILRTYTCRWIYFLPYFGSIFLLVEYFNLMSEISIIGRRFLRSKRYFNFISPSLLIIGGFIIQWLCFWLNVAILIYLLMNGTIMLSLGIWFVIFLLASLIITFVLMFIPVFFRTQVEYAIAASEITLGKRGVLPDLVVGMENTTIV